MSLVLRRIRGGRSLLLAATGTTLAATALLTALAGYGRQVADSGTRSAVRSATAEERSILIRGSASGSARSLTDRDTTLRARVAKHLPGVRLGDPGRAAGVVDRRRTRPVGGRRAGGG